MNKLMKALASSRRAHTVMVSSDGPALKFSFEDDDGKLTTVTLYDTDTNTTPVITKTERL